MIDPIQRLPEHAPKSVMMSACEVLTWIAYGVPQTKEKFLSGPLLSGWRAADDAERWGTTRIQDVMRALEARTDQHPYCAVRITRREGGGAYYPDKFLSPKGPRALHDLRAKHRRTEGRNVSFGEMAHELRDRISSDGRWDIATIELTEALRAQNIIAFGIKEGQGIHVAIPFEIFLHPRLAISPFAELTLGPDFGLPDEGFLSPLRVAEIYTNVQFRTTEIMAVWPQYSEPKERPQAPRRSISECATEARMVDANDEFSANVLPNRLWMEVGEIIAWIAFREPIPHSHWHQGGKFNVYAHHSFKYAHTQLTAFVAGGKLAAWGRKVERDTTEVGGYERIPIEEFIDGTTFWPGGWLEWPANGNSSTRRNFRDIRVSTADVERLWPPHGKATNLSAHDAGEASAPDDGPPGHGAAIYQTGAQGRPTSKNLVTGEFRNRLCSRKVAPTLAENSRNLEVWLQTNHPQAPPMTAKTIETSIRAMFNAYKKSVAIPQK